MASRRQFFQASSMTLAALASEAAFAREQSGPESASPSPVMRDYWNDLPNYLIAKVNAARRKRKNELAELKSRSQADERTGLIRTRVWDLVGGQLERTPLNARTTGAVERGSYRIEKVIFESQPEFYVTAHLYIPKSGKGPYPGILAPVGHAPEGKAYRSYQTLFQNLADRGCVVLTWDPPGQGERLQYIEPGTDHSRFGPTGEHDRFGWPALLVGSTTTQFEAWDGVRALDYLLSRPEVDATRIGCCGHSGGGTQTMFLCGLEPRIHAAVVVEGHTENLAGADYQPPGAYADAEQNLIGGLKIPLDRGDLLGAFAPKPLLICYTPIDIGTTYSPHYLAGTEEIISELKSVYRLYESEAKVALFASTLPHDYDYFHRRSTYGWFEKWLLGGQGSKEEIPFEDAAQSTLWCTSTGQVLTSMGGRAAFQVNYDRLRTEKSHSDSGQTSRKQVQRDLREVLNLPTEATHLQPASRSKSTQQNVLIEEIEYQSEPGIRVPGWFLKPSAGGAALPVALLIQDQGRDLLFDQWPLIEQLTRSGLAICSVDLRTCGVTQPRLPSEGPSFYGHAVELAYSLVSLSVGCPIIGQQTWDLLRCLDYLHSREDVDHKRIGICGTGIVGLASLAAAVLDQRCRSLLMNRTLVDLESIIASKDYELPLSAVAFGMLRKFDLPELAAHLAPRSVWLVNTIGPQGNSLSLSETHEKYRQTARAYAHANRAEDFSLMVEPDPVDRVLVDWVRKTLI